MLRPQTILCFLAALMGTAHATWNEYQILAFIGKPIKPVELLLDLSTSDIWIYSKQCKNCPSSNRELPSFNGSNTDDAFKMEFTTKDNEKSGTIQGSLTTDYMLLVPDYNTKTEQHRYAQITSMTGADEAVDPYGDKQNGRIGLGLNKKSATSTVDLFFGQFDKLLCLLQTGNFAGSMLTLGQKMLDQEVRYKTFASASVLSQNNGLWLLPVNSYEFGKYYSASSYRAQLSTTTSYISVPSALYGQIVRTLNAFEEKGELLIDCSGKSKAPGFTLDIGGYDFKVWPDVYIVDGPNANDCIVKFREIKDQSDYFVLGTTFLDTFSFCLNYDTQAVNFLTVTGLKNDQ